MDEDRTIALSDAQTGGTVVVRRAMNGPAGRSATATGPVTTEGIANTVDLD